MSRVPHLLIGCLLLASIAGPVWDSAAVKKVREGIGAFVAGEYVEAGKAFDAADSAEPDNHRIKFDQACALNAQGKLEGARELFQEAALARDTSVAADAHYNLGNLTAVEAKEILGTDPVNVEPEKRSDVVAGLLSAVGHYRDALRIRQSHTDARHNLELIRQFLKHIQAEWEKRDRDQARKELGLLEFLAMLESRQENLRTATRVLNSNPGSPQQRQTIRETAVAQRKLQEEIGPLKEKITAEFQQTNNPQAAQVDAERQQQAEQLLHQLADNTGRSMLRSADQLESGNQEVSTQTQREILDELNEIYMVLAPFQHLLQRAIPVQEQLLATSKQHSNIPPAGGQDHESQKETSAGGPKGVAPSATDPNLTSREESWRQSRISDWAHMLTLKAAYDLPQVETQLESVAQNPDESTQAQDDGTNQQPNPADQLTAMADALRKAEELAPQVEEHSVSAEEHLQSQAVDRAVPDQEQALRLLKEIAKPLEDQQNKDNQQQNNEKSDQQQDQQNGKQQEEQQDQQQQQQQDQQQQSSQRKAESVLRRAREREREHRDREKELKRILRGVIPVDRDW